MITGQPLVQRTEREYRRLDFDSSSTVKDFADDRRKYYKKYVLGEVVEDEDNVAIKMGKIVESLMLDDETAFDRKFVMSMCDKVPSGMLLDFCNALYVHTMNNLDEEGTLTRTFAEIAQLAYADSGYKISVTQVLSKFEADGQNYYRELLAARPLNKTIVSVEERTRAQAIVDRARQSEYIRNFITAPTSTNVEFFNQLQIDGFEIDGLPLKAMLDNVIINHRLRTGKVTDVKVTWNVPRFYTEYYLHRKSYLQIHIYQKALRHWLDSNGYAEYTIELPGFLVCDSGDFYEPLYYQVSEEQLEQGYTGFEYKGRTYEGLQTIIPELKWCKETNIWNITREHHENRAIAQLK